MNYNSTIDFNTFRQVFLFLLAIMSGFYSPIASSAEREVCYHMRFNDSREACPARNELGARRGCKNGETVGARGHFIELWDKNDVSADVWIGTFLVELNGENCVTFEWDKHHNKTNPDVYLRYINKVQKYDGCTSCKTVEAFEGDLLSVTRPPVLSWRSSVSSAYTRIPNAVSPK